MAGNWINEMIAMNNYFFATLPTKDGVIVFPMHKGGFSLCDDELWEAFGNLSGYKINKGVR